MWINGIEDPDVNPNSYEYLIFDKEHKLYNEKKKASSTSGTDITESTCRRMQRDAYIFMRKTQVQVDQRPKHTYSYTDPDRRECR